VKRYGNLYEKIYDMDNLRLAHRNARKNKAYYKEVQMINENEDIYLKQIQNMLISKTYETSRYEVFKKWDRTKEREIYKLPYYPDRIVQWAVMLVIEPILVKKLVMDTYSAIPNKGIHVGLDRVKKSLRDKENTQYCLKFDIHHYYPSINHQILKDKYRKIFKDKDLLWLLDEIIDSTEMSKDTGIPIGNYISQWSANIYLSDFDHWLKETKQCKYVFRYMDDVVILSKSKDELYTLLNDIKVYLSELKLDLKGNYQIFPVDSRGIDFLGYRMFRHFTLLRKSTCKNLKRKSNTIKKKLRKGYKLTSSDVCSVYSYIGWIKWCNAYRLRHKYLSFLVNKIKSEKLLQFKEV
jgi:hypothetical protein